MTKTGRDFWLVLLIGTMVIFLGSFAMTRFVSARTFKTFGTHSMVILIYLFALMATSVTILDHVRDGKSRLIRYYQSWRERDIRRLREKMRNAEERRSIRRLNLATVVMTTLLWMIVLFELSNWKLQLVAFPRRPFSLSDIGVEALFAYGVTLLFYRSWRREREAKTTGR